MTTASAFVPSCLRAFVPRNSGAGTAVATLAAAAALAAPASAQDLTHKAPPQSRPVLIDGATIHTVSGESIENGRLVFTDGRIEIVADGDSSLAFGEEPITIDARGKHVYPAIISPVTNLGLSEISSVRAMRDYDEVGQYTPEVRAAVAVNPDSTLLPVARSNGVLVVGSFPEGGRIPGRASLIHLDGWTWEDMTVEGDVGLVVNWPRVRPIDRPWGGRSQSQQEDRIEENLREIERYFDRLERYARAKAAGENGATDQGLDAALGVLPSAEDQRPLLVYADEVDQIASAVTFCAARGLRAVIVGGRDAVLAADLLKAHDVAVILNGVHGFPARADSPHDDRFTLARRMEEAGLTWCFAGAERSGNERNLPYEAARAVAHGLDREIAIEAITLRPAQILGVGDELGSIEKGKRATIILTDGDPLEITTNVERAWIDGREIDLRNKQTDLRDKYREKYRQLGIIGGEETGAPADRASRPLRLAPEGE